MKMPRSFNQGFVDHYRIFSWRFIGRGILLLTTVGRKSGLPRTTPVQYEIFNHLYTIGAGSGFDCDWVKNIQKNPKVSIQVGNRILAGWADLIVDRDTICNFLAYRIRRHPLMLGMILKRDGLSFHPNREELYAYASRLALVVFHPDPSAQ
jgi:deazaflavin-dependent oxidoreductase (nitroreductase family)